MLRELGVEGVQVLGAGRADLGVAESWRVQNDCVPPESVARAK